jgi:hypothetical protein
MRRNFGSSAIRESKNEKAEHIGSCLFSFVIGSHLKKVFWSNPPEAGKNKFFEIASNQ